MGWWWGSHSGWPKLEDVVASSAASGHDGGVGSHSGRFQGKARGGATCGTVRHRDETPLENGKAQRRRMLALGFSFRFENSKRRVDSEPILEDFPRVAVSD